MNCPFCGKEMKKGTLCGRGDSYFLPDGQTRPKLWTMAALKKRQAVLLPPESFGAPFCENWPEAFWCEECRKMVVDYERLMPR
ncbi:MAG: PF20097 family protein [Candidatus Heteroscillospira sp.]|jgi:hypothetical protein